MRNLIVAIAGIGLGLAVEGCAPKPVPPAPQDPTAFLKWSMDRYADMPDFQGTDQIVTAVGNQKASNQDRTIRYQRPNKFRVESKGSGGEMIVAVSDGTDEQDYDNLKLASSNYSAKAPATINLAQSGDMLDPSLCGSPLYGFFGGSKNFASLVKGPVTEAGPEKPLDGEQGRMVQFDTPGVLGHVKAIIGVKTGFVYALHYDLSGAKPQIMAKLAAQKPDTKQLSDVDRLLKTSFTELYLNMKVGQPLSRGAFDPNLPGAAAVAALDKTKQKEDTPIPLNEPAPDFTLRTMDGKTVSLSQLKGHPVMIDFWATWCAPCRMGLPDTAELQALGAKNGLQVLAVTDEEPGTINNFLSHQAYRLTAYRDQGDTVQRAFQVGGLPSQVFIDAKGNVVQYLVGYHPSSDARAALKSMGVKL